MLSTWRTGTPASPLAEFHLSLRSFDGPFDLLVHLIEKQGFDITAVSLVAVTAQYLDYVRVLESPSYTEATAEFLAVASQLLLLKSRALLPAQAREAEEFDDAGRLADRLRVYSAYRRLALELDRLQTLDTPSFVRLAAPGPLMEIQSNGGDLAELMAALERMLIEPDEAGLDVGLPKSRFGLRERIAEVREIVLRMGRTSFAEIAAGCESKLEIVYTFIAVLHLVAQRVLNVEQKAAFGPITLSAVDEDA